MTPRDRHWEMASQIWSGYKPPEPLHLHIKKALKQWPQAGSRDRKRITEYVYSYVRLSPFCGETDPGLRWTIIKDGLEQEQMQQDFIAPDQAIKNILGMHPLSIGFDRDAYLQNHQNVSPVFLHYTGTLESRDRVFIQEAGGKIWVEEDFDPYLKKPNPADVAGETFNAEASLPGILMLPAGFKLEQLALRWKGRLRWEVQDLASILACAAMDWDQSGFLLDACAGSGGKSLFFVLQGLRSHQVIATDTRPGILKNLEQRFKQQGFAPPFTRLLDWAHPTHFVMEAVPGLVLLDVPCSGSGTWNRNPEAAVCFRDLPLEKYVQQQRSILQGINTCLPAGTPMAYTTCSVYRAENEEQVEWIQKELGWKCRSTQLIQTSAHSGDVLFLAQLTKL